MTKTTKISIKISPDGTRYARMDDLIAHFQSEKITALEQKEQLTSSDEIAAINLVIEVYNGIITNLEKIRDGKTDCAK